MMSKPIVKLIKLIGFQPYKPTWELQKQLVGLVKKSSGEQNFLLLLEHSPVFTTGIRVDENVDEKKLKNLDADVVKSNRGGLVTFHGPGQLVAYPILDLKQFFAPESSGKRLKVMGMKWYIHTLEQVVIDTLKDSFGLTSFRSPHTGVWVDQEKKICAMGVHNSDLVTCHGLALNCDTDLSWFGHIIPCGLLGKGVTSLTQELGRHVPVKDVISPLTQQFAKSFNCHIEEIQQ